MAKKKKECWTLSTGHLEWDGGDSAEKQICYKNGRL